MSERELYDLEVEWEQREGNKEELLEKIPTELLEEGDVLYEQGNPPVEFSLVKVGKVEVAKYSAEADKTILGIFGPGEPIGALAVINEFPYPARVTALQDTIVYRISGDLVEQLQEEFPAWFSECIGQTAGRMNNLASRFQSMTTQDIGGRLSKQLCDLIEQYGQEVEDGIKIDTKITRQMLADMVGCRVESAIRKLSEWEQKGLISTDESFITITDPHRLSSIASEES
ncbi:MAG: Crp/Fnr family transcriptional regulator [bacterium]